MNITHIHNYVFLPCIAGEHRYCRAEYITQYNTALGEIEAGHCICPCHVGKPRKEPSEPRQQKPQAQTANARKVRG